MKGNRQNTLALVSIVVILLLGVSWYINRANDEEGVQEQNLVPEDVPNNEAALEIDIVYQTDSLEVPTWAPTGVHSPPWEHSIYLASSGDGLTFIGERFFVQHAGVPNLLLTNDDKIVATFQYFSYEEETLFDRIVYTVSDDYGQTWSPVKPIKFDTRYDKGSPPVDPTLVQLGDGRYRLYYTFQEPGTQYAALYSSSSTILDGVFDDEGVQLSTTSMLLDPAVVFYDGMWHHYTVNHEGSGSLHSVSSDGLGFTLEENILSDYQFLGGAIVDDGKLMFYGTGNGVVLAESDDGYVFRKVKEGVADGADPGIVKLPDGSYLIVYTK